MLQIVIDAAIIVVSIATIVVIVKNWKTGKGSEIDNAIGSTKESE